MPPVERWFVMTLKPLPKQNVTGQIQLYCRANNIEGARHIAKRQVTEMNETYVKDRFGKPVKSIQWELADLQEHKE